MSKFKKIIALILVQAFLLTTNTCLAYVDIFPEETLPQVKATLSPQITIDLTLSHFFAAHYQDEDDPARRLLSEAQFGKYKAVRNYYNKGLYESLMKRAYKVINILKTAPMLKEVYGIGFPFYGNVDIRKRMQDTMKRIDNGEISADGFLNRITPDLDTLIVVDYSERGPLDITENMDDRLKYYLIEYVTKSRRMWAALNKQMQTEAQMGDLYADREEALDLFTKEGKLLLDIVFVPLHVWNEMPVFIMPEDIKYFKFIRDILFSLDNNFENSSAVPNEFLHNYVLNVLSDKKKIHKDKLFEGLFSLHPYSNLLNIYEDSKKMVENKYNRALNLAINRGMITFEQENLKLTKKGEKYLNKIHSRRNKLLNQGYDYFEGSSFISRYEQWLEELETQEQEREKIKPAYEELTIEGSDESFYVKDKSIVKMFDSIQDGSEVHIAAPGGGGDSLGAILFILELKEILRQQGKKNISFKIIFPSIKYGKENPYAGDLDPQYIQGIERIDIQGVEKSHFYKINEKLGASIPIFDNNNKQITLDGVPVFYDASWSESKIIDLLVEDGIELIMIDISQKAGILRQQYEKMKQDKNIVSMFSDCGGDCLAQIPEKIKSNKHLEATVASPVSDLTGLVIFNGPATIKALGGDGELLGRAQRLYIEQLSNREQIGAIFDDLKFLKKHKYILKRMNVYKKLIRSEVSTNLLTRLERAVDEDWDSLIERNGPWNYPVLMETDKRIDSGVIRYENRRERLSGYYLSTLIIKDTTSIRNNVITPKVLDENMTWSQRREILRSLNYATEGLLIAGYRSQIKHLSRKFLVLLADNKCSLESMLDLFESDDISIVLKLALARAIFMYSNYVHGYDSVTKQVGRRLHEMMYDKEIDVFLIAEVAKTIGIVAYDEAIETLRDFRENPKKYGKWSYFPLYFYNYIKKRLNDTAERSIRMLIEKVLSQKGSHEAWGLYQQINGTHKAFEELKTKIITKMQEDIAQLEFLKHTFSRISTEHLVGQAI